MSVLFPSDIRLAEMSCISTAAQTPAIAIFPKLSCAPPPLPLQTLSMTSSPPSSVVTSQTAVLPSASAGGKDSRWLTLEVCREHVRRRCSRSDDECRFAHPPSHVEVQNGRVVCCFDSIKGRCQRTDPPCKYLHPPQHLKEQLLQNGRNNLIMKNLQLHRIAPALPPTAFYSFVSPYLPAACYTPAAAYYGSSSPCSGAAVPASSSGVATVVAPNGTLMHQAASGNLQLAVTAGHTAPTTPPSSIQLEPECDDTSPSSGSDQYWAVAPPTVYTAIDTANSPTAGAGSYYSPMFFQSVGAAPSAGVMLKPHQAVVGDAKTGYAVYSCGSTAYHQLAMPFPQAPYGYPMTIAAPPPPLVAGSYQRY